MCHNANFPVCPFFCMQICVADFQCILLFVLFVNYYGPMDRLSLFSNVSQTLILLYLHQARHNWQEYGLMRPIWFIIWLIRLPCITYKKFTSSSLLNPINHPPPTVFCPLLKKSSDDSNLKFRCCFWLRIPLWNIVFKKICLHPVTALLGHPVQKYF